MIDYDWLHSDAAVSWVQDLTRFLPALNTLTECPMKCGWAQPLHATIVHLNDDRHHWSREAIADWLESLDVDLNLTFPQRRGEGVIQDGVGNGGSGPAAPEPAPGGGADQG